MKPESVLNASGFRNVYRRYTVLERGWSVPGATEPVARQLFRQLVHSQRTEAMMLHEFRSFELDPPPHAVLNEAFSLQQTLYPADRKRPGGRHPDDPLEDVYAAALSMLPHGFWVESPDRAQVYRGQRDARWRTIPSLFRRGDAKPELDALARVIPRIQACLPRISEEQSVAVAQHYSKELDVSTWLLDVTYDPRVALFFASDGGVAGEIGVVTCIVQKEWDELSAGGTNRLGRLHVIDVPGVLRIERQRASFLDTSHPILFEQYVPHSVWFRQHNGVHFEDPAAPNPVAAEHLYPSADPFLDTLERTASLPPRALHLGPAGDAREALDAETYWDIAQSWCSQEGVQIDVYREDTLRVVCDVHARLQSEETIRLPERSLARLQDAVRAVIEGQRQGVFVSARQALRWTLARLKPQAHARLDAIITECEKARNLC